MRIFPGCSCQAGVDLLPTRQELEKKLFAGEQNEKVDPFVVKTSLK